MKAIITTKTGQRTIIEATKILLRTPEENSVTLVVLDGDDQGTHVFSLYNVVRVSVTNV
jgi:hypothetical protein